MTIDAQFDSDHSINTTFPTTSGKPSTLAAERNTVRQLLEESIAQLYMPFDYLARAQLQKADPLYCATTVLATCTGQEEAKQETNDGKLKQQRLYLGAALEMLQIALTIHQLLLQRNQQNGRADLTADEEDVANQRSITGSIILTGDYCFTQSAILAAKTNNVRVVEIFSQTLQHISEKILRQLFAARNHASDTEQATDEPAPLAYDTEQATLDLCKAGIKGSAALIDLSAAQIAQLEAVVASWLRHHQQKATQQEMHMPLNLLSPTQQQRWHEVLDKRQ